MLGILLAVIIVVLVSVLFAGQNMQAQGDGGLGQLLSVVSGGLTATGDPAPFLGAVGIPIEDSDYREGDVSSVDTWTALTARDGTTVGGISVASSYNYVTSVKIQSAITAAGISAAGELHGWIGARLSGSGLYTGGTYRFVGQGYSMQLVGSGDLADGCGVNPAVYPTAIPTKLSGTIDIEGFNGGEDIGTTTVSVTLTFASIPTPGGYVDMDLREGDLTAVDTLASVAAIGATTYGDVDVPRDAQQMNAVVTQVVVDPGTSAAQVGFIIHGMISGTGLLSGGTYRFPFPSVTIVGANGGLIEATSPHFEDTEIGMKGGNKLTLQATMIGADPGGCTVVMCIGWR